MMYSAYRVAPGAGLAAVRGRESGLYIAEIAHRQAVEFFEAVGERGEVFKTAFGRDGRNRTVGGGEKLFQPGHPFGLYVGAHA